MFSIGRKIASKGGSYYADIKHKFWEQALKAAMSKPKGCKRITTRLARLAVRENESNKKLMLEVTQFCSSLYFKVEQCHQCQSFWKPDGNGNWEETLPERLEALKDVFNLYKKVSHDVLYGKDLADGTRLFCLMLAHSHRTGEPQLAIKWPCPEDAHRVVHLDRVVHPRWAEFIWPGKKRAPTPSVKVTKDGQRTYFHIQLDHLMQGHNMKNGLSR